MEKYEAPVMEIIRFSDDDILAVSLDDVDDE